MLVTSGRGRSRAPSGGGGGLRPASGSGSEAMEESAACVFSWSRQQELSLFEWFSGAWCDGGQEKVATRRLEAGTVEAYGPDLQLRKRVDGCGEADLGEEAEIKRRKDSRVGYNGHNPLSPAAIEGLL